MEKGPGSSGACYSRDCAEFLLGQKAERKPVTVQKAGHHSTEVVRVMLKPHELHILLFMSSGSSEGELSQREVLH